MIRTRGLRQFAVRDAERAFKFYQRLFGIEEVFRDAGAIFVSVPGGGDIVTFTGTPDWRPGDHRGLHHYRSALEPDLDVADAVAEVEAAGGTNNRTGPHGEGQPYIYFTDLADYDVELFAP